MRKITLFLALIAAFLMNNVSAQSWVEDVYLFDDFGTTGGTSTGSWVDGTLTQGYWTGATQSTSNTFSSAINATNKNVEIKTNVKIGNFVNCTKTFSGTGTPYASPSGKLTVSFICKIGSAQTYSGSYFYFRDNSNKPIFGLGFARISAGGGNKWLAVGPIAYTEWLTGAAANYANITTPALLPTPVDAPALKVTAVLDFSTHTYSLTAMAGTYTANASPEWVDGTNIYSGTGLNFLDNTASNVSNMFFEANGLQSSSSATATNFTFDNFKIAGEKQSLGFGNVTVKYVDTDGNSLSSIKPDISHTNLSAGVSYPATDIEKANFSDATYYYAYDASVTTDNVMVVANTTTDLTLKFKKYPLLSGSTLTWTGAANGTWNFVNYNFTSDGTNSIGFQNTNAIILPAAATTKAITLNSPIDLGSNNLTISGTGYSLTTGVLGSIAGTGALNINLGSSDILTLNAVNNMTGTTQIAGGNITVSKTGSLGAGVNITESSTLTYGAAGVTIPSTTFGASSAIVAGAINASLINGMSAADGIKVSVSAAMNHGSNDTSRAFDFVANGTLASGSELELNGTGTDNRIGMTSASATYLANTKVSLKGAAMLYINTSHSTSTINIGTLAGDAGAKLGWGRSTTLGNDITWSVGASNLSSEFAGTITNTGGYSSGGSSYIGNFTHFIKEGTRTLTMSGTANTHNGNFTVNGGELKVTGAIGNATSVVTVAAAGKLSGTGTVGGATTVNGTLEGRLNFGSTLALAGTTNLVVNGFNTGEFDVITVTGAATLGGVLNITVNASAPASGTTIKLINAASYSGDFTQPVNVPSNYTFDKATGILTYTIGTNVSDNSANKFNVYPTMTSDLVHVDGENVTAIDVISITGQFVKQVQNVSNKTTINLSGISTGAYLVKVRFADGSVKVQRILLQK
jgi:autotransporter-associated beta strand protein